MRGKSRIVSKQRTEITVIVGLAIFSSLLACSLGGVIGDSSTGSELTSEPGLGGIAGKVWSDICEYTGEEGPELEPAPPGCVLEGQIQGNGTLDVGETGIQNLQISLGDGACPSIGIQKVETSVEGIYLFVGLSSGSYCVSVDASSTQNHDILSEGRWTFPPGTSGTMFVGQTISLEVEEVRTDVDFAWDSSSLPPGDLDPTPTSAEPATETPLPLPTATSTASPSPSPSPTALLTPSPTLTASDPRANLGNPDWLENFEDDNDWPLFDDDHVKFELGDELLTMTAFNADHYNGWVLTWRTLEDFYLEATGSFGACSGRDGFGLMLRAADTDQGYVGYLFGISCDGRFSLRSWDGDSFTKIVDWTSSTQILAGPNKSNRIGIWAQGDTLRMYANGDLLTEVMDSEHQEGIYGLFVGSAQTANLTVEVSEVAYWLLP